jgi:hypothetical protein
MPSIGGLAASRHKPASACRAITTTSMSACSKRAACEVLFDRAQGPRGGRQCRLLDRHDHTLDRLAAHYRWHPRMFSPAASSATRRKIQAMPKRR